MREADFNRLSWTREHTIDVVDLRDKLVSLKLSVTPEAEGEGSSMSSWRRSGDQVRG